MSEAMVPDYERMKSIETAARGRANLALGTRNSLGEAVLRYDETSPVTEPWEAFLSAAKGCPGVAPRTPAADSVTS